MDHHVKILTRVLSRRLALQLKGKLDQAQSGFSAGKSTLDHMVTVDVVLADAKRRNKNIHLVTIDCARAFDSVEFWALRRAYMALGLSDDEVRMLSCTDGGTAQVVTPAGLSPIFNVEKGVRQGEVLSPTKFNIWLNVLLQHLRLLLPSIGYKMGGSACNTRT